MAAAHQTNVSAGSMSPAPRDLLDLDRRDLIRKEALRISVTFLELHMLSLVVSINVISGNIFADQDIAQSAKLVDRHPPGHFS